MIQQTDFPEKDPGLRRLFFQGFQCLDPILEFQFKLPAFFFQNKRFLLQDPDFFLKIGKLFGCVPETVDFRQTMLGAECIGKFLFFVCGIFYIVFSFFQVGQCFPDGKGTAFDPLEQIFNGGTLPDFPFLQTERFSKGILFKSKFFLFFFRKENNILQFTFLPEKLIPERGVRLMDFLSDPGIKSGSCDTFKDFGAFRTSGFQKSVKTALRQQYTAGEF